jgi:hypothetical protein
MPYAFGIRSIPVLVGVFLLSMGSAHAAGMHGASSGQMTAGQHGMAHGAAEVGNAPNPPTVKVTVHPDAKAGWNLQVQTQNFRWAPERASTAHVAGEGHAHLYIDGKKITRLYGEWYFLPSLRPGSHTIRVTLNANTHEDYTVGGKLVEDTVTVVVKKK